MTFDTGDSRLSKGENVPTKTSEARLRFYHDVLVTAIEDPHSVFQVLDYHHYSDTDKWPQAYAVIKDVEDEEGKEFRVTLDTFAKAFSILEEQDPAAECVLGLHRTYRRNYHNALRELEAGDIDCYDAMCILQVGLFGEVLYS